MRPGKDQAHHGRPAKIISDAAYAGWIQWLSHQSDEYLDNFSIVRSKINGREFYPRLVLGDYFQDQFRAIIESGRKRGHIIEVHSAHRASDIALGINDITVRVRASDGDFDAIFDHVVMATGHTLPDQTEVRPGYFSSPWPAAALESAGRGRLGVLGTSLSGIDALLTVASSRGSFVLDRGGDLQFLPAAGSENFSAAMMSRKGLLPEADFYCPLPYLTPSVCTQQAVGSEIASGPRSCSIGFTIYSAGKSPPRILITPPKLA